ncbi:S-layer homology domain-containing protein [Pectinatus sottacetonis]|uniref:S-layer homology domain-containing protein n=1 Tax=Pectinatus sottacetonis TaxID=1002795 RepID=UPI0018C54074|nr:S-layer homology domain-containing protein [Pectinatus sottacetonis]
MKKKLLLTLLTTGILLNTPAAFAAENPFSSVPKDHWAYSAVEKLVQDGLVDGYGDADFRGEKFITRYEMAQILAKAMSNQEKASTDDKNLIEKLEKEYSNELDSMNIRISNIENKLSSFKWFGDARIRYQRNYNNNIHQDNDSGNSSRLQERLRLGFYGTPAPHLSVTGRLKMENTNNNNDGWGNTHDDSGQHNSAYMDLLALSWQQKDTTVSVGRQEVSIGQGIIWWENPVDGIYVTQKFGKNSSLSAGWGDLTAENWKDKSMNAFLANLKVGIDDKTSTTLGYLSTGKSKNNTVDLTHYDSIHDSWTAPYKLKQISYGINRQLFPKLNLLVEGVTNRASDLPSNAQKNGWWSRLTYGKQDWSKANTYNIYADYLSLGNWSTDSTGWGHILNTAGGNGLGCDGEKGFGIGVSYMLAANTNLDVNFYKLRPYDSNYSGFSNYKNSYNVSLAFSF